MEVNVKMTAEEFNNYYQYKNNILETKQSIYVYVKQEMLDLIKELKSLNNNGDKVFPQQVIFPIEKLLERVEFKFGSDK